MPLHWAIFPARPSTKPTHRAVGPVKRHKEPVWKIRQSTNGSLVCLTGEAVSSVCFVQRSS